MAFLVARHSHGSTQILARESSSHSLGAPETYPCLEHYRRMATEKDCRDHFQSHFERAAALGQSKTLVYSFEPFFFILLCLSAASAFAACC